MKRILLCLSSLVLAMFSCTEDKAKSQEEKPVLRPRQAEVVDFDSKVQAWNMANKAARYVELADLYADEVVYYGSLFTHEKCMNNKRIFFQNHPDFYQRLIGEVKLDTLSSDEMKCTFLKRAFLDGVTSDYPSYLVFTRFNNQWLITSESDYITDENLR